MQKSSSVLVIFVFITAGFGFGLLHAQDASQSPAQQAAQEKSQASDVPAYHTTRSKEPLPVTLDPAQFPDQQTKNVYALAAKVKNVLYQQPCYCHCDKEIGHTSLLSCYTDRHAAVCALCQKEAVLAYTETQKGKTPAQIRKEIIDGKWKDVDLSVYETPAPSN